MKHLQVHGILICLLFCHTLQAELFVAFWNVENLFDLQDDPLTHDEDFTPTGKLRWTQRRLHTKQQKLAHIINDLNGATGPDILGVCEVENRGVLEDLVKNHLKRNYRIVHQDSPDERGIDCAILYDHSAIRLENSSFIHVELEGGERTRDIVEAEFSNSQASFYLFINHWSSRYGRRKDNEKKRIQAAKTLRKRIDYLEKEHPRADILIMGDFNDSPDNASLFDVLLAKSDASHLKPSHLFNSSWPIFSNPNLGTLKHRKKWQTFDQIILSQGLLDKKDFSWKKGSTRVFLKDALIHRKGRLKGYPFRTYGGPFYMGGYSDHLPIYCRLDFHKKNPN